MVTDTWPTPKQRIHILRRRSEEIYERDQLYNIACDLMGEPFILRVLNEEKYYNGKLYVNGSWIGQNEQWIFDRIYQLFRLYENN